jgi:signal transduction histidine kinase
VYFLVAEALTNATRYSGAGRVEIRVDAGHRRVSVEVRDDGHGGAEQALGSGLKGLADRVAALDGSFEVISPAGAGTIVRAVIPCA